MPFLKDTMVEVNNDVVPWYGQVQGYEGGMYAVRLGGSDIVLSIDEKFVKLHPALKKQLENAQLKVKAGTTKLKLIDTMPDHLGSAIQNRLCDTIVGASGGGTILTVCNINALLTLMWPSSAHVVVVDIDQGKINHLKHLITLAEGAKTMIEWQREVFATYGPAVLDRWVNKYRPSFGNFLALQSAAQRVHILVQDLAAEDTLGKIAAGCSNHPCLNTMGLLYVSNIEFYVHPKSAFGNPDPRALGWFKKNILALMQQSTRIIHSTSPAMKEPQSKEALEKEWA